MARSTPQQIYELSHKSTDCSFLLTHLVRQVEGKRVLRSILGLETGATPMLRAHPTGFYDAPAICFTESTLPGLKGHRDAYGVSYGIAFQRETLYPRGASPCLNIREDVLKEAGGSIPASLRAFVNPISEHFDPTYEREWRVVGDLWFKATDLRFIFCPEEDFKEFAPLLRDGTPTLFDLRWLDRF